MRHDWQRRREPASHTDDWLMTYADMITLLLCFFAIFLSVSLPHAAQAAADKINGDASLQAVEELPGSALDSAAPGGASIEQRKSEKPSPAIKIADVVANAAPLETVDKSDAALLEIVNRLKSKGASSIEQQGDRLTTLQISSAEFFASGSAALSNSGRAILKSVAVNLQSDKYKSYQVTVEGHTDDSPISTLQFPSNWELSTARAAAVVHCLLQQGILAQRLRAAGYADTFPVALNRDAHGQAIPENQARNRRVVIKLEKIEKMQ
jgi:chemotaxis protein MotB